MPFEPTSAPRRRQSIKPGDRFGRLTVVRRCPTSRKYEYKWVCLCDCQKETTASACNLRTGAIVSCGCYRLERLREEVTIHGRKDSRAYAVWMNMRARCGNPKNNHYHLYGGRGIGVCAEWQESFSAFYADMGDPPLGLTLDRVDVNKGYCKSNCRWATATEQARNTRFNRMLTWSGRTQCIADWADETGIAYMTILSRLNRGWDVGRALETPIRLDRRHRP